MTFCVQFHLRLEFRREDGEKQCVVQSVVTLSKSKTQLQEVCKVSSIVLLLTLMGHGIYIILEFHQKFNILLYTSPAFVFITQSTTMFTCVFQDRYFLFSPLFQPTKHFPSLWKVSRSNPHPPLSNCMRNDVMLVLHCLTSFRKKTFVYY